MASTSRSTVVYEITSDHGAFSTLLKTPCIQPTLTVTTLVAQCTSSLTIRMPTPPTALDQDSNIRLRTRRAWDAVGRHQFHASWKRRSFSRLMNYRQNNSLAATDSPGDPGPLLSRDSRRIFSDLQSCFATLLSPKASVQTFWW
jgi:hypothetical protein